MEHNFPHRIEVNGVPIDCGDGIDPVHIRRIPIGHGRVALMRPAIGQDLINARKAAGKHFHKTTFALIAETTTVDGRPLVLEDLEAMPIYSILPLQAAVSEYFAGDEEGDGDL